MAERFDEMFTQLAAAVYAGDLAVARDVLDLMRWSTRKADLIMKARRMVHPGPGDVPMAQPFILPVPGHLPGSTLAVPIMRDGK